MKLKLLAFTVATACASLASAQNVKLPAVNVTATPIIEDNRIDAFSGVSAVVGEDQLRDQNAVDLAAALRRTPGVQISRFNPVGSFGGEEGGAVFVRGMGASRPGSEIKTYVDGIPFYLGIWNHPLLDLLPLNGMQLITVNKSPQPHVSGNNFASIDLQTKRAREEGLHGDARISAGSFGTVIEQANLLGRSGDVDFMLAQGYSTSNGHRPNADGELQNIMGRIGLRVNANWSLSASFLEADNKARDPGNNRLPAAAVAPRYDTRDSMLSAAVAHQHGTWKGELRVHTNDAEADWLDQPGDTRSRSRLSGVRWREEFSPWRGATVIAGIDHDRISGTADFGGGFVVTPPTMRITSPYVALSQRLEMSKEWALVPSVGVRAYDHSEFTSKDAPHVGLSLESEKMSFFANYARGVNYPALEVAVLSALIPALGSSWRTLSPEELDHAEIGAKFTPAPGTTIDVSLFEDKVKNRYIFGFPPNVPPPPQFINLGSYRMRGTELAVKHEFSSEWSIFGGLTLLDPSIENLPYAPDTALTFGVNGRIGPVGVALDGQYQSEVWALNRARAAGAANLQRVDSFTVVNARFSYALPALGKRGEVFLAVENLFDRDYQFRPGYPMPGRGAQLGLSASF